MSRYYEEWAPYVSVAERRSQAERQLAKLRKQGRAMAPVIISGRAIATTFWGKSWSQNLESYRDFEHLLERGRSYVRNGLVIDLQLAALQIKALVSGSSIYEVAVSIAALPKTDWRSICRDCAGGIDSLVELLRGRFSKPVMERLCRQEMGLFPRPSQIKFSCSCFDHASMCKHVAAVLYAVAARLDEKPELLFLLRSVDEKDLLTHLDAGLRLPEMAPSSRKLLAGDDLSALFGLDMGNDEAPQVIQAVDRTPLKPVKVTAKIPQRRKAAQPAAEPVKLHKSPPKAPPKQGVKPGKAAGKKP